MAQKVPFIPPMKERRLKQYIHEELLLVGCGAALDRAYTALGCCPAQASPALRGCSAGTGLGTDERKKHISG